MKNFTLCTTLAVIVGSAALPMVSPAKGSATTVSRSGRAELAGRSVSDRSRETVLYSFLGGSDGAEPESDLAADSNGVLYGTTWEGGLGSAPGFGTVFKLTPSASGYTKTTIYSFSGGDDGLNPIAAPLLDKNGVLYGSTYHGGVANRGTLFKLTPTGSGYVKTILHSFTYSGDGIWPRAPLIFGPDGALFGTAEREGYGSGTHCGTVFKISTDGTGYSTLHVFACGFSDGDDPTGALLLDHGVMYSTTRGGGAAGQGTVYKVFPSGSGYAESIVYSFPSQAEPWSYLAADKHGNLYGTTRFGGTSNMGSVFKVSMSKKGAKMTVLHSFLGGADGEYPFSGLQRDKRGKLYGTTVGGGVPGSGTIFEVRPNGVERVLWHFGFGGDARAPEQGLLLVNDTLFGSSQLGGYTNSGTVYSYRL